MAFALRRPYRERAAPVGPRGGDLAASETEPERSPGRTRIAAARGAWAVGSVMTAIARLVRLIVGLVVLVIAVAIVLRVAGANPANVIVRDIHDAGRALVGPFNNVFSIKNPKAALAINWGLAAIVYLLIGSFVARLIARAAPKGVSPA